MRQSPMASFTASPPVFPLASPYPIRVIPPTVSRIHRPPLVMTGRPSSPNAIGSHVHSGSTDSKRSVTSACPT